jgi:hypothetical protein
MLLRIAFSRFNYCPQLIFQIDLLQGSDQCVFWVWCIHIQYNPLAWFLKWSESGDAKENGDHVLVGMDRFKLSSTEQMEKRKRAG